MNTRHSFAKALTAASLATLVISGCAKNHDADGRGAATPAPTTSSSTASGEPNTPATPEARATSGTAADASNAIATFGSDLFEALSKSEGNRNLAVSPWSVESALALVAAGAKGDTLAQMVSTLGYKSFADNPAGMHHALAELNRALDEASKEPGDDDDRILESANAVWVAESMKNDLQSEYTRVIQELHRSEVHGAPFMSDADGSRRTINQWVARHTDDKIQELLKPGTVTSATSMVLTNAVYFDADWVNAFDSDKTRNHTFHRADGSTVDVKMMNQRLKEAQVWDGHAFMGIDLPYEGDAFSMSIVLPDAGQFEHVRGMLFADDGYSTVFPGSHGQKTEQVQLGLPKFQFRWSGSLVESLKALGMTDAFSGKANFSSMFANTKTAISDVVHEVYIDVDEEGTEAAAATGAIMMRTSAALNPPEVRQMMIDRPFLFVIRDTATGTPIFMGQVLDPTAR